ncbi:hypothetical protein B0T19DRAFT_478337 [Cercophora scortea]|uniref:BHLH domain-containing protein n=1 Tax=Cercophora scortea TaxID=314031 RepID=A0AAE0M6W0_9PEZI|nr:hypothetical protein B0T19DRAFT_478337 [Cercophora scortea]
MGPGQEPHGTPNLQTSGTLPFGYSRHDDASALQTLPFGGIVDPSPQGQPLLTDLENHHLDMFWGQINGDADPPLGEGLSFDLSWSELPGEIVLAASSFMEYQPEKQEIVTQATLVPGELYEQHVLQQQLANTSRQGSSQHQQHQIFQPQQQPQPQHQLQLHQHRPEQQQQQQRQHSLGLGHAHAGPHNFGLTLASDLNPSPDVLAAASALYPNQNTNRPIYYGAPPPQQQVITTMAPPFEPIHHQHQPYAVYGATNQSPLAISPNHMPPFNSTWSLAPPAPSTARPSHPREVPHVVDQWGSDQQFNQTNFTPANSRDSTEAMLSTQMSIMGCLTAVDKSAANTRASSPVASTSTNAFHPPFYPGEPPRRDSGIANVIPEGDQPEPAKKRQKSKVTFKPDGRDEDVKDAPPQGSSPAAGAKPPPSRRRKSSVHGPECSMSPQGGEPAGADSGTKRRRSGSTTQMRPKTPRENLSEEQKRTNHIRSEQKRRGLIADGYASLTQLVPCLKENNFSKSQMLNSAADYLAKLKEGNQVLEALFLEAQGATATATETPATGRDTEG